MKYKHRITWLTDILGKFRLYDITILIARKSYKKFIERIIALAKLNGNEKVLDVGCGTGTFLLEIAKKFEEISIYGIDISENLINLAKRKAKKGGYKINFRIGTALDLPYHNDEFDVVFTQIMFHQFDLEEKQHAVQEIYRVLKSGGIYISAEFGPKAKNIFERRMAKGEWSLYPSHLKKTGFKITYEKLAKAMWNKKVFYRIANKRS